MGPDIGPKLLLPALVAVGGSLAASPATALELGEARVTSTLGQPLRASIAYALAPNEALYDTCVSLQRATPGSELPMLGNATVKVANGIISITGKSAVREPLMSMRINIRCAYTPQLSRDYMLFVDPARPAPETVIEPAAANAATPPITATVPRQPTRAAVRRQPVSREPIGNATRYRVQPGDSLSQIAQRIENRPVSLWDAVAMIFDANPGAFINDDPNLLKAGSWLLIPDFGAAEPPTVADDNVFRSAPQTADPAAASNARTTVGDAAPNDTTIPDEPAPLEFPRPFDSVEPSVTETTTATESTSPLADLQPGDVILDSDSPFISTSDDSVVIPDTTLEGPQTTASTPNVPTATVRPSEPATTSSNWLWWLVGGGLAMLAALLLFGRNIRDRFGSTPIDSTVTPKRRKSDFHRPAHELAAESTIEVEEIRPIEPMEYIDDDSPTEENLALDADLVTGTGLHDSDDADLAQDFGFAATTDLDLELPEEMSSGMYQTVPTDVIPPLDANMESMLESEVVSEVDDDDYDMSVIVDATKMPDPGDVTERDFEAVAVATDDDELEGDDYSVSQEADYQILEQDYEDEFTATQRLNKEIARAAEKLATRMDQMEPGNDGDDTSEVSMASITTLDVTAQHPANNDDDVNRLDALGDDETLLTVKLSEEKTVEMVPEDKTVEMPADGEETNEIEIKSGRAG